MAGSRAMPVWRLVRGEVFASHVLPHHESDLLPLLGEDGRAAVNSTHAKHASASTVFFTPGGRSARLATTMRLAERGQSAELLRAGRARENGI